MLRENILARLADERAENSFNAESNAESGAEFEAKFDIEIHKSLPSTNTYLKKLAENGAPEGKIVIAEEQTAGKGRLGRSFFSPGETGIYMSFLLRPSCSPAQALYITPAAAVAAAEAIEEVSGRSCAVKWVNDLWLGEKKVAGILTESAFDEKSQSLAYAILGIGINLRPPKVGFPDDLKPIVTGVFDEASYFPEAREAIIASLIKHFFAYYKNLGEKAFLAPYRERSFLIGRAVNVIGSDSARPATVLGVDDDFRLRVRYDDGSCDSLQSGEVSVRPR